MLRLSITTIAILLHGDSVFPNRDAAISEKPRMKAKSQRIHDISDK
jgi:hypothetical protein